MDYISDRVSTTSKILITNLENIAVTEIYSRLQLYSRS